MNKKIIENINLIKSYKFFKGLASLPFINKIYLYGSRAKGDNKKRADIDLAFFLKYNYDWSRIIEIIEEADTLLKIDYVNLEELEDGNPLKNNIQKEGKIIFERK